MCVIHNKCTASWTKLIVKNNLSDFSNLQDTWQNVDPFVFITCINSHHFKFWWRKSEMPVFSFKTEFSFLPVLIYTFYTFSGQIVWYFSFLDHFQFNRLASLGNATHNLINWIKDNVCSCPGSQRWKFGFWLSVLCVCWFFVFISLRLIPMQVIMHVTTEEFDRFLVGFFTIHFYNNMLICEYVCFCFCFVVIEITNSDRNNFGNN